MDIKYLEPFFFLLSMLVICGCLPALFWLCDKPKCKHLFCKHFNPTVTTACPQCTSIIDSGLEYIHQDKACSICLEMRPIHIWYPRRCMHHICVDCFKKILDTQDKHINLCAECRANCAPK